MGLPALNEATAKAVGVLCAKRGIVDVVDAPVALCARLTGSVVITTDPEDIRVLDPQLTIQSL